MNSWIKLRLLNELFSHKFVVLKHSIESVKQGMKLNSISLIPKMICEVFWINVVPPGFKNSRFLWTSFNRTWGFIDEKCIIKPCYQNSRDTILFKTKYRIWQSWEVLFNFHPEVSHWSEMLSGIRNDVSRKPLTTASVSKSISGCYKDISKLIYVGWNIGSSSSSSFLWNQPLRPDF